jgi:hypothetical protein
MQAWSGLNGLREAVEPLRRRLRTFRDVHGRELFDLPDAPRPDSDAAAPPRFLPEFDNVLLAHADRTRIVEQRHRRSLFAGAGLMLGSVLIDGFVRGRWRATRTRSSAMLTIQSFVRLASQPRAALEEEGERFLRFVAADAQAHDVRFCAATTRG